MAEKVNDERPAQAVLNSFMCEEVPHVRQITRVLAVECSDNLAAYRSAKLTTGISANPNSTSTRAATDLTAGS
jgi:hypothetical protein